MNLRSLLGKLSGWMSNCELLQSLSNRLASKAITNSREKPAVDLARVKKSNSNVIMDESRIDLDSIVHF
jgi:hypothetical protein